MAGGMARAPGDRRRYEPRRDRLGNWVPTVLGRRYDAFLSFEMTEALHPLHLEPAGLGGERETYPWNT
jgi:erythromycin esterase